MHHNCLQDLDLGVFGQALARLLELGTTLGLDNLSDVECLHISAEATPAEFADMIAGMAPKTVTLNGSLMTGRDVPALLHFSSLQGIVAHRIEFATVLLSHVEEFPELRSIAMSNTLITDNDVAVLADRVRLSSIHFSGTSLTDVALRTFGTLPDLEVLDLRGTLVTDDGIMQLQDLTNLFTIDVRETAVTITGAKRYRDSVGHYLPDVEVLVSHVG